MNNTIHASTTYDEKICESLVYLMLRKLRKWPRYALLLLGLLTAVGAGWVMLAAGQVSPLPFLVMILGSMLCTVALFLCQLATKMLIASYGKHFPTFRYAFTPEELRITCGSREQAYSYAYVLRLLEMSGLLFMFMRDGQVYILRQSDVQGGYKALKAHLEAYVTR